MADIVIRDMEMPKEDNWKTIRIYPDGTCAVPNWQGDCTFLPCVAIPLPEEYEKLIDMRPMIKAHWIETAPINEETMKPLIVKGPHLKCSNCGSIEFQRNYCPNCGADMEGIIYNEN